MIYGVQTPAKFWKDLREEVERIADEDGDWEQLVQERIAGLEAFLIKRREKGDPATWQ